jgi:adenosine deaminase
VRDAHVHLEASLRLTDAAAGSVPPLRFAAVLRSCAQDLAGGGASEALLRYNPVRWVERGVETDEQLELLRAAAQDASERLGLRLRFFATLKRDAAPASWAQAVDFAIAGRDAGVAGVDVSRSYSVSVASSRPAAARDFGRLGAELGRVAEAGLTVTVHCGWYDSRAELEDAIAAGAQRIAHGTPLVQAPDLDAELAARGAVVEVCPTAYERRTHRPLESLPVGRWLNAGLAVEVGSDHPCELGTTTRAEHDRMAAAFGGFAAQPVREGAAL